MTTAALSFSHPVRIARLDDELTVTLACVEAASFRPKRLPQSILDALTSTALQK